MHVYKYGSEYIYFCRSDECCVVLFSSILWVQFAVLKRLYRERLTVSQATVSLCAIAETWWGVLWSSFI